LKITIIHPTRQRPERAYEIYEHWIKNAHNPNNIEYILSVDTTDTSDYSKFSERTYLGGDQIIRNNNRSAVDAVNNAAKVSNGDILIVVSDDFNCHKRWDTNILRAAQSKTDWLMKTQDKTQPWIITLPIMDRAFYNRFGYIYYPSYSHKFVDTDLTSVGDLLKRTINAKHLLFEHKHYSTGKNAKDAVSEKADSTWNQGEKLYLERYSRNFDLNPEEIKGRITAPHHLRWLRSKGVRI
jgi:hypothetical protein